MATRKRPPGLLSLGDPATLSLTEETQVKPVVRPLNFNAARLLLVMPPLTGDPETVALGTLLRTHCLGQVVCWTMHAWESATPEDRETPECERQLLGKWREWVAALLVPTTADWWVQNGRGGAGVVLHRALVLAATCPKGGQQ